MFAMVATVVPGLKLLALMTEWAKPASMSWVSWRYFRTTGA